MSSRNGYIGSLLVHGGIVVAAVLFAYFKPEVIEVQGQDPLLLEVWTGDGSDRAPGIPGRASGAAMGSTTGNKTKSGLPSVRKVDANRLIKELHEAEARAAAEAAKDAKEAKEEKADKRTAPDKSSKTDKKESLEDFKKTAGKTAKSTGKTVATTTGKTAGSGKAGKTTGITGSSVGSINGKGDGEAGFGRANGKGQNGGEGGSGDALKLFVGDINGKFSDAYQPIFEDQGGGLDSSHEKGVVRLIVSPAGIVSFGGWIRPPADPLMERIVKAAIAKMPAVRRPPSGQTESVRLEVSGAVNDA